MTKRPNPTEIDLPATLEGEGTSSNILRIDLHLGFQAKRVGGGMTIASAWMVDMWEQKPKTWVDSKTGGRPRFMAPKPRFLGTLVGKQNSSPAALLRELASIYEAGRLPISRDEAAVGE